MSGNIILIDDHTLFRRGIRSVLDEADYEVIGEAADGLSGVKLVEQLRPDLVLTVSEDGDELIECMKQGAHGFLLKNINADFFIEAVGKALNGDNVFSPEMTAHLVKSLISPIQPQSDAHIGTLTPRERETLHHLAIGHSNKVIAKKLNLAESTVKAYVQSILRKLGLSSRVQAAVYAIQHDIRPPEKDEE